jgi:uncharacterized lipoprotein YddW (UPF0748 family)
MKRLFLILPVIILFQFLSMGFNRMHKGNEVKKHFTFAVWGHGDTTKSDAGWDSVFTKLYNVGITDFFILAPPSELKRMVKLTKGKGIRIHGWIWVLNRPNDSTAEKHPDWYAVNRLGENSLEHRPYVDYYQWLSPFSPGACEYIKSNIRAVAKVKGLASVHLDYVRFCDVILGKALQPKYDLVQDYEMPEYDFGYHPLAREKFKEIFGIDPMKMDHPELSNEWRQFRLNAVTSLVNGLAKIAHENGKEISAAVFPYPELARMNVRQDWSSWNLDLVLPMLYQNFYDENLNWIGFSIRQGLREIHGRFPLYAGLYIPSLSPDQLKEAVIISKKNGAAGASLFDISALTDEHLKIIKELNKEFNPN